MKGKNYKIMGMKAIAVFSILSMTVFSFSYDIAYAHGNSSHDDQSPSGPVINIMAKNIVCDSETDLPDWASADSSITINADTADNFLSTHSNCRYSPWVYEWAQYSNAPHPNDLLVSGGNGWTTFNSDQTIQVKLTGYRVDIREQYNSDFIPFTGVNKDQKVSAELYCADDVEYFDNLEEIENPNDGQTYHCISFNAPKASINIAPIANAGDDQTIDLSKNSSTTSTILDGSKSTDPDGTIVSYAWTFVSGPTNINPQSTSTPSISGLICGTYVFKLTVTDNKGASSDDSVTIIVDGKDNDGHSGDHGNHGDDNHGNHNNGGHDGDDDNGCDKNHKKDKNCEQHENTAPVITLNGSSTVIVYVGDSYIDLGANANDKEDGDLTSSIISISNVDTSTAGSYTVKYNVKDSKGLCADTVTRTVIVKPRDEKNNAPVLTLLGLNPVTVTQGDIYLDAGATAFDIEDGDITANIVKTGTVDTSVVGTYTVSYDVKDSKGLAAETVTRTVNIVPLQTVNKGKITFCLVLADSQNTVATSSYALPEGIFTMSLGTTTGIATTTLFTKTWSASSFAPNQKVILGQNDSDCVSYGDLELGTYKYSEMSVNGSTWNTPRYNDQNSQPVNNVFDFALFDFVNDNADGEIILTDIRSERTLYVYSTYKAGPSCDLPEVTSGLTASATVNQNFSFTLNASSTSQVTWDIATTSLPTGVTFATSTNTISGTPTTAGTYSIAIKATNTCGFADKVLVLTVSDGTTGGGGTPTVNLAVVKVANRGAANTGDDVQYTITIENRGPETATNVKVTDILPGQLDFTSASTTVGSYATSTGIWTIGALANGSTTELVIVAKVKSGTEGQNIANTATGSSDQSDSDTSNNTSTVNVSVLNPNNTGGGGGGGSTGGGGGGSNGPIVGSYGGGGGSTGGSVLGTTTPTGLPVVEGCNYLLDYLRRDFNNNPYEVTKLQLFLRNLEGFTNLPVNGIYDQATIDAVNVFQMRYKDDVLTPWGHTAPTSFVYILTKKKVNEIYCKMVFPVTAAQQEEINNYRNSHPYGNTGTGPAITNNEVGYGNNTKPVVVNPKDVIVANATTSSVTATSTVETVANIGLTTLAGFSSTTKSAASEFVANILSSGKRIGSLLGALFAIPGMLFAGMNKNSCTTSSNVMSGLNIVLLVIIAALSYFWYRERKNNKTIEEINKEIDLK